MLLWKYDFSSFFACVMLLHYLKTTSTMNDCKTKRDFIEVTDSANKAPAGLLSYTSRPIRQCRRACLLTPECRSFQFEFVNQKCDIYGTVTRSELEDSPGTSYFCEYITFSKI